MDPLEAFCESGTKCPGVALFGCQYVAENCRAEELDACEAVVAALRVFGARDTEVAWRGLKAIYNLTRVGQNWKKLYDAGVFKVITCTLKAFGRSNEKVAEHGLSAMYMMTSSLEYEEHGIETCEAVCDAMKAFWKKNIGVALSGLMTIESMCSKRPEHRALLGKAGACSIVVEVMDCTNSATMAWHGCATVASLAYNEAETKFELIQRGACEVLVKILYKMEDKKVQLNAFKAMYLLLPTKLNVNG